MNRFASNGEIEAPCGLPRSRSIRVPSGSASGAGSHRCTNIRIHFSLVWWATAFRMGSWSRLSKNPSMSRSSTHPCVQHRARQSPPRPAVSGRDGTHRSPGGTPSPPMAPGGQPPPSARPGRPRTARPGPSGGPTRDDNRAVHPSRSRSGHWYCGSPGRSRGGATAASRASWSASATTSCPDAPGTAAAQVMVRRVPATMTGPGSRSTRPAPARCRPLGPAAPPPTDRRTGLLPVLGDRPGHCTGSSTSPNPRGDQGVVSGREEPGRARPLSDPQLDRLAPTHGAGHARAGYLDPPGRAGSRHHRAPRRRRPRPRAARADHRRDPPPPRRTRDQPTRSRSTPAPMVSLAPPPPSARPRLPLRRRTGVDHEVRLPY